MTWWHRHAYLLLYIVFSVASQLIIRWRVGGAGALAPGADRVQFVLHLLAMPWVWAAFLSTFLAGVMWMLTLGRLDLTSEGLLLLTNDGALKRRLELPSTGWLRRYRVRAHGDADDAALEPLRRGMTLGGERFQPMQVTLDRRQGSNLWLTVALREGRNREVRRALETVGLAVNRLIRVSYGPFQLGDLPPGAVEEVRPKVLREQLGLPVHGPVIMTGHQAEFWHPGILAKYLACDAAGAIFE